MELTKKYADQLDKEDVLSGFRKKFIIPEQDGVQRTYFLGNSLGFNQRRLLMQLIIYYTNGVMKA